MFYYENAVLYMTVCPIGAVNTDTIQYIYIYSLLTVINCYKSSIYTYSFLFVQQWNVHIK